MGGKKTVLYTVIKKHKPNEKKLHPTFSLTIKTITVMFSVSVVVKILIMQTGHALHGIPDA